MQARWAVVLAQPFHSRAFVPKGWVRAGLSTKEKKKGKILFYDPDSVFPPQDLLMGFAGDTSLLWLPSCASFLRGAEGRRFGSWSCFLLSVRSSGPGGRSRTSPAACSRVWWPPGAPALLRP